MSVKMNIDGDKIIYKIDRTIKNGMAMLSAVVLQDCNKYCKEDTGTLMISSYVHSKLDEGKLVWQTPYAARQYYEIRTAYKDVNSQASWRWCEVAKTNHLDRWQKQAQAMARLYK